MIRIGKTYKNLMVDVSATNEKLNARAIRIVMQATECNFEIANTALSNAKSNTKLAILNILTGVSVVQGAEILKENSGFLRKAVDKTS